MQTIDYSATNPFTDAAPESVTVTLRGWDFSVVTVDAEVPPTERQLEFIAGLAVDRRWGEHKYAERIAQVVSAIGAPLTRKSASALIDTLMECPKHHPVAAGPMPEVPAGRYAVDTEEGHTAFYKVDRPTEGRWAGRTFVSVMASDEQHPVRGSAARAVLAKIATDPAAASERYGREIGACGVCGKVLTNEDSREAGIGPVCREKQGW